MFSQHRAKQSEIIQYIAKQNKTITQHIKQKTIKQKIRHANKNATEQSTVNFALLSPLLSPTKSFSSVATLRH